jgi:hypothetical protein
MNSFIISARRFTGRRDPVFVGGGDLIRGEVIEGETDLVLENFQQKCDV